MNAGLFKFEKSFATFITEAHGLKSRDLGLRYDRVVASLTERLKIFVGKQLAADQFAIVTLTAPIKLPAETCKKIEEELLKTAEGRTRSLTFNGNQINIHVLNISKRRGPRSLLLVHNPPIDSKRLIQLATEWLAT